MKSLYLSGNIFLIILCSFLLFDSAFAQTSDEQSVISTQILQTETSWNGKDLEYPESVSEQITALHIEFAPGAETEWHRHPVASLAYIISGELEVILRETGLKKVFREGDAFAEVVNTWHYGKNIGDEPVKLVVFYIGEKDVQLTELLSETED